MRDSLQKFSAFQQIIDTQHKNSDIVWSEKGQMNYVALVDSKFVYKFPKNPDNINLLEKEYELYCAFHSKISLAIPEPIEFNQKEKYLKVGFVKGSTLTKEQASSLSEENKIDLANKISIFISELNSPELYNHIDDILQKDFNDFNYVDNWLRERAEFCEMKNNRLCVKYVELYKEFRERLSYGFCTGTIVSHKDLHEDNMLFDDMGKLVGIIDFAEVRYSSIHSELRTLIRFGDDVVERIINSVGTLADGISVDDILLFAKTYELAILVRHKYMEKELQWRVELAEFYLQKWGVL